MRWYLYSLLLLQVLASTAIFVAFKLIGVKKVNEFNALVVNYLIAIICSFSRISQEHGVTHSQGSLLTMWPAVIIGFLFLLNFYLMMASTRKIGVGMTSAFSKMSALIPVIVGVAFLNQVNNIWLKVSGVLLTLLAFYFILYKKRDDSQTGSKWLVLLPISVFFFSGVADVVQELARKYIIFTTNDLQIFLFIVFLFALLFSLCFSLIDALKNGFHFSWYTLLLGGLLGISNYFNSKLLLINVNVFGGSTVFPIVNAATVLVTTFVGMVFFKEKLNLKQWVGIGIAVLAVVLIAAAI